MSANGSSEIARLSAYADEEFQPRSGRIASYLTERVTEYKELTKLRQMGWNNQEGDEFFKKQRRNADKSNPKTAKFFYEMMQNIAGQLQQSTDALAIPNLDNAQKRILDLCMAPGGFLNVALRTNPGCQALAFSLPTSSGGHKVLLPAKSNVTVKYLDITMLAADMGMTQLPSDHADAENFLHPAFPPKQLFDLVLCDGQVLRTHIRAPYREGREARRLAASQLVLGLERVRPGGTMVVLLHRVELWSSVSLLYRFSKFSSLTLFKPTAGHAKRSSFYMVAKDIEPLSTDAGLVIKRWKEMWEIATFGTEEQYETAFIEADLSVDRVLEEFGPQLIRLGTKIWRIQAEALAAAPFMRKEASARDGMKVS